MHFQLNRFCWKICDQHDYLTGDFVISVISDLFLPIAQRETSFNEQWFLEISWRMNYRVQDSLITI